MPRFKLFIKMKILGCAAEEQARGAIETAKDEEIRKESDRKEEKSSQFIAFGLIFYAALYPTISIPPESPALGMALVLFLLGSGCMAFAIIYISWLARKMCSSTF
ncbi:MAG: hypothetical protein JJE19_00750 [Methanosarcinales archaeon]|nr:hypothetical protein [Methanosarcinales archaeon]